MFSYVRTLSFHDLDTPGVRDNPGRLEDLDADPLGHCLKLSRQHTPRIPFLKKALFRRKKLGKTHLKKVLFLVVGPLRGGEGGFL